MARILLVEDEEFFRLVLSQVLENLGHSVDCATNGREAEYIFGLRQFDLVISDVRMPIMDGVALLRSIKAKKSTPFVLMTGFAEILETHTAAELGADGFLAKPFSQDAIKEAIDACLAPPAAEPVEADLDDRFHKISMSDFVSGKLIPFGIYIRLSSRRYVKIATQGEDIALDRIKAYQEKGVRYLYLEKDDFLKYIGLNLRIVKALPKFDGISKEKKLSFIRHTGEVLLEQVFKDGINREAFENAQEYVEGAVSLSLEYAGAQDLITVLNSHADQLYAHSLGVALYGVMIARHLDWNSSQTLYKVSLGGLFHDIGMKEIDPGIFQKPRLSMTQEEIALFESHPRRGYELLSQLAFIPEEVQLIAYQHHEDMIGQGYPLRLQKTKIFPLARVIAVADRYCLLALKNPQSPFGMDSKDAISELERHYKDTLDSECLAALKRALQ
ncbi:MAG TPA: HD domain-containing phosphohydrolase [Bdellovibrionota bacterium]|nr:HD domain-containing phosphohydrolase [Bdellovibrionota bacterium]